MNQLDDMIARSFSTGDFPQFVKLAKRKLKRLHKQREERDKTQSIQAFRLLKMLPELRKKFRTSEKAKAQSNQEFGL